MLNETRQLLNEFYEPYNQELADIMDDDQFLWEPEENDYESMEDKWISIPTIIFLKVKCEWIKIVRFQRFFFYVWVNVYVFFRVMIERFFVCPNLTCMKMNSWPFWLSSCDKTQYINTLRK